MATTKDCKVHDSVSDINCIYDALDKLGYSKDMAEKRVKIVDNLEVSCTMIARRNYPGHEVDVVIPGSAGEGLGISKMSDIDFLYVQRSIKCFQNNPSAADYEKYQAVFQIDTKNAPSGYTWLESKTPWNVVRIIHYKFLETILKSLYNRNGIHYLGNDRYFVQFIEDNEKVYDAGWFRKQFEFENRSGSSRPFTIALPFLGKLSIDYVPAFPCSYPFIENWCTRRRKYDWPSKELRDIIAKSEVFVVLAGRNDTDDDHWLQWRLSFTLAERALVRSFNDVQIKLYSALKLLAKCNLKPVCEQISSYVVKNVIFWAFEDTKAEAFTKENFQILLLQILGRMKEVIAEKHLSNYMTLFI